jgi:endonuclease/exonuclease/phosphatase family metal-dependent hydrolase
VWSTVDIPATGGWQNWVTVNVPVTLGTGVQQMTLLFDTGAVNVHYADVIAGGGGGGGGAGGEVIVAAWNIEVNASTTHARAVIDQLMALSPRPQVIVLQEAYASMFNTYIDQLQIRTALTWRGTFQTSCPPGAWNGSACIGSEDEGVGVFTSLPVLGSGGTLLPFADQWHSARAVARLAVSVNGVAVQVYSVHLQVLHQPRYDSMAFLKIWAANFAAPQLVGGDFNADPDQICTLAGMSPAFVDSWSLVGLGPGYTAFTPSPTMKLDYWFADASGRARPNWSTVATSPGMISDHFPVVASFTIRP